MNHLYALVDCNNFYVSCERLFKPWLEGKPVVVLSNNDGCIVSRSEEAKQLGVPMAAPYFKHKHLFKQHNITVFSSNYSLYGDISHRVMETVRQFTPEMEIYSIDEAFLHLYSPSHLSNPTEYGRKIRETVMQWVGIPISIGIAPTKTLAKIAGRLAKKIPENQGVFDIHEAADVDGILRDTEIVQVWGIGNRTAAKVRKNGIISALDLKKWDDRKIREHMSITGLRTARELRGEPCITLEQGGVARKSILCSRSFGKKVTSIEELQEAVASYAARTGEKLRSQKSVASYIQVFIRTSSHAKGSKYSNSYGMVMLEPTSFTPDLIAAAHTCLKRIYREGYHYYKAGLVLGGIRPAEQEIQSNMLAEGKSPTDKTALMQAMDTLNRQWGRHTLTPAAAGTNQEWRMQQNHHSLRYTTQWEEVMAVGAVTQDAKTITHEYIRKEIAEKPEI